MPQIDTVLSRLRLPLSALLACSCLAATNVHAAVRIDGVIDADEWRDARVFSDFVEVQPATGLPLSADRQVTAKLLPTPDGIAVAMSALHPASVPQTRSRIPRDSQQPADQFTVVIDFNADGIAGYSFTVTTAGNIVDEAVSNENVFSTDWDGDWSHAAASFDGGYAVEMLIPWTTATMADSTSENRDIGIYLERAITSTGEKHGYPDANVTRPRFLSDLKVIGIRQYADSLFTIAPYSVVMQDLNGAGLATKVGGDAFWKPNGDHQFALSVNPDFGQVESDELVVNFTTTETVKTDKRPFFTDNNQYLDLQHPVGQLFYTRRVGGPSDDARGAADIATAFKGIGRFGDIGYGAFFAQEAGQAGRSFLLARTSYGTESFVAGLSATAVDRPYLDRDARVVETDVIWTPDAFWRVRPIAMASFLDSKGDGSDGLAGGVIADWDPAGPWRQQYTLMSADEAFELNDLGYQARNDFVQLEWEAAYRIDLTADDSKFADHDLRGEYIHRENHSGLRLLDQGSVYLSSSRKDGGSQTQMLRWKAPQFDDRITRGHGPVRISGGPQIYLDYEQPRRGDNPWGWYAQLEVFPNARSGHSVYAGIRPQYRFRPDLDIEASLFFWHQTDWLLWQTENELGSFFAQRAEIGASLNWLPSDSQEVRVKLQAIAVDAEAKEAVRATPTGDLVPSDRNLDDFSVKNLGFQIRYRYAIDNRSEFYAVYGRGGIVADDHTEGFGPTIEDTFALDQDHQLMFKYVRQFRL